MRLREGAAPIGWDNGPERHWVLPWPLLLFVPPVQSQAKVHGLLCWLSHTCAHLIILIKQSVEAASSPARQRASAPARYDNTPHTRQSVDFPLTPVFALQKFNRILIFHPSFFMFFCCCRNHRFLCFTIFTHLCLFTPDYYTYAQQLEDTRVVY